MPIVHPEVENPDELLAWPATDGPVNRIQIERSATGGGIGYANIGSVTIVAGVREYTYYDGTGERDDWYRWYFSNAANSFPIAGQREYSPEQQPSALGAGLLCSLEDVKQELGDESVNDELIMDKIRQVSVAIEGYCGRWLAPRPADPTSTTTLLFDVESSGASLLLYRGDRLVGIRTLTALGVATASQRETGGTYINANLADVLLRPRPTVDGPAIRLQFTDFILGGVSEFSSGHNVVSATGSFGPATVPEDIQGVAIRAVVRRIIGKSGGGVAVAIGPSGTEFLLPDMSGADRWTLEQYRLVLVGSS